MDNQESQSTAYHERYDVQKERTSIEQLTMCVKTMLNVSDFGVAS
jgi:hypothetical protein